MASSERSGIHSMSVTIGIFTIPNSNSSSHGDISLSMLPGSSAVAAAFWGDPALRLLLENHLSEK